MRKAFVEQVALPEPRFRDGLGIRYVRTDGTDDPVEVLRPLWDVGMMQNAIRQRVSRLASFRQARFVPVRAAEVPRDDASTIEIVSDYMSGHRLSQYLEASKAGVVSIETSTAIYILRELLGALALLHESRGVTHGAVGPERILVTPKGRVVLADYVLGPAIERLEFTRARLWREFRIAIPAGKSQPKLDDKADVLQVAVTALALLLGRPIELAEYPERIEALLAALGQTQKAAGRTPLPAALVGWLKRALFKDPNGKFANVSDARLSLEGVLSKQDAATGGASALKALADAFGRHAAVLEARAAAAAAEEARQAALAAQAAVQAALQEQAAAEAAAAPIIELVPASSVGGEAQAADAAALQGPAPVPAGEPEPAVGWRVPETPQDEETLPTSPLIQLDAQVPAPAADAFAEEVLDLAGIATSDETEPAAADTADAAAAPVQPVTAHALAPEVETAAAVVEVLVDLRNLAADDTALESRDTMPAGMVAESGALGVEPTPTDQAESPTFVAAVEPITEDAELIPMEPAAGPAAFQIRTSSIETADTQPALAAAEPTLEELDPLQMAAATEPARVECEAAVSDAAETPPASEVAPPAVLAEPVEPAGIVAEVLAALEAQQAPPAAPSSDVLPEWRVLADPMGAAAPTIDVEVPSESLDELVAAFAASLPPEAERRVEPATVTEEPSSLGHLPPTLAWDAPAAAAPAPAFALETPPFEEQVQAVETAAPDLRTMAAVPAAEAPAREARATLLPGEESVSEPGVSGLATESAVVEVGSPLVEQRVAPIASEAPAAAWVVSEAVAEAPALEIEPPEVEPPVAAFEAEAPVLALDASAAEPVPAVPSLGRREPRFDGPANEPDASPVAMEPPAIMVKAAVPFLDAPAPLGASPAAPAPEDGAPAAEAASAAIEILDLQEAQALAQAAAGVGREPAAAPDLSAWSFVEELLHHDARFEQREAAEEDRIQPAARAERSDRDYREPVADVSAPAFEQPAPSTEASAPALDRTPPFLRKVTPIPAERSPAAAEVQPAARDASPGVEAPSSVLPDDWFIEVGSEPVAQAPALADWSEPAPASETPAPPPPLFGEAAPEIDVSLPPAAPRRPVLREPDEDLSGPVFPRVAPSVQRVRAEARRRRVARLRSGIGRGVRSVASGFTSGAAALVHGVASVFTAAGRGVVAAVAATVAALVAVLAATARGLGALAGAAVAGIGAAAQGVARASAASVRGLGLAGRAVGGGTLRLVRAAATGAGSMLGAIARGGLRGLGVLARGIAASAGMAVKAAGAVVRTAGALVSSAARGLGAGAAGLGRAAGRAASAASAAGTVAGRGSAAAGKGAGRAAATLPRKLFFLVSDVADRLPKPVFRPWYLAAALLAIAAVAGVPYAKALLSTPKVEVGTLRVESARPDELVTVDGVPHGRAPVTVSVPAGRHRIEVGRAGQMRAHDVEVAAGRETFLQAAGPELKAAGSIRVSTDPPGAEVLVDGMLQGTAPLTIDNLAEGAHTLLVRDKSGSVRQTVQVKAEETTDASVQLRPGWLAVFAPVKLTVLENGKPIGSTEGGRMLIAPGPHTVDVVSQAVGYRETRSVEIKPGQVSAVTIQLPPATIEVVAPPEAEVFVDGQSVGLAPLGPLQVAVGTREITMRHPALGERRQVVSVTYTAPVKVVFE